jgi:hypothetical protein
VAFDQGAYAAGLVVVPLYVDDRPENFAYILEDAGVKVLLVEGEEHWKRLAEVRTRLGGVKRIVSVKPIGNAGDERVRTLSEWIGAAIAAAPAAKVDGKALATIVYTSGTTGRPKGVMLSHQNMLQNVKSALAVFEIFPHDMLLSFLPLSHMFERTVGYYLTIVSGSTGHVRALDPAAPGGLQDRAADDHRRGAADLRATACGHPVGARLAAALEAAPLRLRRARWAGAFSSGARDAADSSRRSCSGRAQVARGRQAARTPWRARAPVHQRRRGVEPADLAHVPRAGAARSARATASPRPRPW